MTEENSTMLWSDPARSEQFESFVNDTKTVCTCQGRAGEIQDSILQNAYLDMLKLEVENNTQDVR